MTANKKILFIPGMLCDERLWHFMYKNLAPNIQAQCRWVTFEKCHNLNDCFHVIHEKGGDYFSLVGFSMGGFVAIEYLLQYPEKVSSFSLISASANGYSPEEKNQRINLIKNADDFSSIVSPRRFARWIFSEHPEKISIINTMCDMAESFQKEGFIKQQSITLNRSNRLLQLSEIINRKNIPLLIVHGSNDFIVSPIHAKAISELVPLAEVWYLDKCGHMLPLEYPVELANILNEWIK